MDSGSNFEETAVKGTWVPISGFLGLDAADLNLQLKLY